ncbi:cell division protein FtsA [Texcoconibacillus texcoconensis]|uniref:Cell division protein FtsA n=1 Tax=Texcoconibacillus texcoconensis TaxID=1095777 RepID=A0A840QLD6_9BACI|nr:cell division protein FtsA [Texcoconibacillus texcoconensis]MBB5172166.1 cell division protein FtsA [Texcoconibacillus texcoconensis]
MNSNEAYVSLDVGTSNVRVVIGEMNNGTLNIMGIGEAESDGIKKGSIVDIDETVRSIGQAVEQAERMVGLKIKNVVVGVSGNHIQLQPCHGVVAVSSPDREIGEEDITRVIDAAQVVSIPPEREIIDVIPSQFIVDGLDEINDPRGMMGVRLEMEGTMITGARTVLHNLLRCVEKAGLQVADIALQPLAAGTAALSKDERSLGVALIDMGGGSTTISMFKDGSLQEVSQILVGGDHVTNDISVGFRTSSEEAEKIKRKYGHAYINLASDDEIFEVSEIGSDEMQEFSQYQLAHIIEPRIEEMLDLVKEEMSRCGFKDLPGGYVLTGGMSAMPGVLELAKEVLQKNVRMALPDYIGVREPKFTASIGLIQFAHRNVRIQGREIAASVEVQEDMPERRERQSPNKDKKPQKQSPGMKKKVSNWFKVFFE